MRFFFAERLAHPALGVAHRRDLLEHRLHVRGRAAVQRARERAHRGRQRRAAVRAGRRGHARREGRRVEPVLGRADPVRVDRLDVLRVGLAAPAEQELLGRGLALGDHVVGRRLAPVGDGGGARDDLHHQRREPAEVLAGLLVGDLVQLPELPLAREARRLRLEVGGRLAGQARGLVGLGVRHLRLEVVVDEEAPDVLVRVVADELLDVDAAVAERAALAVGLGDLRLDGDDALEPGLEVVGSLTARMYPRGRATAAAAGCAGRQTMTTGVPMPTCSNSHSASGMAMRMQPCERE